ncbi:MAG TPA: NTP transferase domain-containing protein, partial [Gemmatimonadaceae bacterium]|nr:NTP transferase domain-containing protein [Gemmatimonadaceae bacterium]
MTDLHVVILAAGKGTRMKSALPKVLHRAAGFTLIEHVIRAADALSPASVTVIVGHEAEKVQQAMQARTGLRFAVQQPQLGTGHALLQAEPLLAGATGTLVLLSGDVPLLRPDTLKTLIATHERQAAAATVLTAVVDSPHGYGRIVRDEGRITGIVEHKDATDAQKGIREINSGIYAFDIAPLFGALKQIASANAQGEYYLPDLVTIYGARGLAVETVVARDAREILGVNSRLELAEIGSVLKMTKNEALMESGVTIIDPASVFIDPDVTVGADTTIYPGVYLEGRTVVGSGCVIHSGVRIIDSRIDDGVVVSNFCVIT